MSRHASASLIIVAAVAACTSGEDYEGDVTPAAVVVVSAPASMMPGDAPDTITVQVRGHLGQPAPGHAVSWATSVAQAVVASIDSVSDEDGHARAVFSPGPRLGVQEVSATVGVLAPGRALVSVSSSDWKAIAGAAGRFCGVGPAGTLSCTETIAGSITQHSLGTSAYSDITDDTNGTFCATRPGGVDCFTWPTGAAPTPLQPVNGVTGSFTSINGENGVYCAIDAAATAWCWGNNQFGRLGTGTETPSQAALQVLPGRTFREISVAHTHACGLTTEGEVWCWGDNYDGQLGLAPDLVRARPPRRVEGLPPSSGHATMPYVSCALGIDRIVRCWGDDAFGTLGRGGRTAAPWNDAVPAPIARVGPALAVTGTGHGFVVIDLAGRVHAWGRLPASSGVNVPAPILLLDAQTTGFVTRSADLMACVRHAAPHDDVVCIDTRMAVRRHGFDNVPVADVRVFHGLPPSP